jgi:hypothetical protein
MALRPNDLAATENARVEFRADPVRVRVPLGNLITSDGHELNGTFEFSARVGDQRSDRQLFLELLMVDGRTNVTRDDLAEHFKGTVQAALTPLLSRAIDQLLTDAGRSEIERALRNALNAAAFSAGLIIQPPYQLELTSPTLERQQRENAQRSRLEQQAAGRLDHLRQATDLLKQFDAMRAAAPGISAGQVLERIAPADRGVLLEAILASNADNNAHRTLFAVAGNALVTLDLSSDSPRPISTELPATLGPLRSVTPTQIDGQSQLLIGARGGVLLVDPQKPQAAIAFADPSLNSSLGFNRVVHAHQTEDIFATHGEAGLVRWNRNAPEAPSARWTPPELFPTAPGPVRNVQSLAGRQIVCSVGNAVCVYQDGAWLPPASYSTSAILALEPIEDRLLVIHEDATIITLDQKTHQVLHRDNQPGPICAAGVLPWLDGARLLLACATGAVDCVGLDDSLTTRYNSVYRGIRQLAASPFAVAAISPDRQRLIIWNTWDGRAPAHDLHLLSLTHHRIADIAFS